jgi:predicted double-glycine peptidase
MLNKETIQANDQLKDLTPEQLAAIVELSKNDEDRVIAEKTRDFWAGIDRDIKAATGREKPGSVKTYDFLKEVLKETENLETIKGQIQEKEATIADLQQKLKDGTGDAALKAQIEDFQKKLNDEQARAKQLEAQVTATKEDYEKKLNGMKQEHTEVVLDGFFNEALQGAAFKDSIPAEVQSTLIAAAKSKIRTMGTPEFQEVDGKRTAIFRNADGLPIPNPENLQKPFTAGELLLKELAPVLDGEKKKTGIGTPPKGKGGQDYTLNLSGVKNQVEATQKIQEYLKAQDGLTQGTRAFEDAERKLWEENKVGELPIQ